MTSPSENGPFVISGKIACCWTAQPIAFGIYRFHGLRGDVQSLRAARARAKADTKNLNSHQNSHLAKTKEATSRVASVNFSFL
jgi:hypothetical protein